MLYRASPSWECCRDSWCCCPSPFAFVDCLCKASLKTEVSWSWCSNQCGSKLSVCLKAGIHIKKLGETSWNKNCQSVKSCGSSESFENAFIPSFCYWHKTWQFIVTIAMCCLSRCHFCHVDRRESSTAATAFPWLLKLLHEHFQLIMKYFVLRSITSCSPY